MHPLDEELMGGALHPPGRRRLRSATRADGYETWTVAEEQYEVLRRFVLVTVDELDDGEGVAVKDLVEIAGLRLAGHPSFPSGRFTNWVRFVKQDLECEGVVVRVGPRSPQRIRLTSALKS